MECVLFLRGFVIVDGRVCVCSMCICKFVFVVYCVMLYDVWLCCCEFWVWLMFLNVCM